MSRSAAPGIRQKAQAFHSRKTRRPKPVHVEPTGAQAGRHTSLRAHDGARAAASDPLGFTEVGLFLLATPSGQGPSTTHAILLGVDKDWTPVPGGPGVRDPSCTAP